MPPTLLRRGFTAALPVLVLALAVPLEAAAVAPDLSFRRIDGRRCRVIYHQGLETMARQAASLADRILDAHAARYGNRVGRVQIVLADTDDDPNGFATPLPYPLVNVRVAAPNGSDDFGNHEGWLPFVLTHELAHIVHLEPARGVVGFGRNVLGRAPFLFPNIFTPTWMIEGLATYEETEGTAFGRGRNPDSRMVRRLAALEGGFPREDEAVFGLDRWPGGQAAYLFGEGFLRYLTESAGPDTLPRLQRIQSRQVLPYLDDLTAVKGTGASFHAHWREWARLSEMEARREAEKIRQEPLTDVRALTARGIRQTHPRWSPDGTWIAYTSRSLTRLPQLRLIRADGTEDRKLIDREGGSALSWTPDGKTIVYEQPEVHRTYYRTFDLYAVDVATGRKRRLTRGARARDPEVAPDGARVVFVRRLVDRSELSIVSLDGAHLRLLTRSEVGTEWGDPHWSPSGEQVVASRFHPGGWLDIVLVDAATGDVSELTLDRAKDVEPSFTADGEAVVFRSDRDSVSNLYAYRFADQALLKLTNVMGGAFTPDAAPDGRRVAFASYSSRGYDIALAELDLDHALPAAPFVDPYPPSAPEAAPETSPARPYRPVDSLWPRFWSPLAYGQDEQWQVGVATGGSDPLFRHVWGGDLRVGTETGRIGGDFYYQYDRFRPTFLAAANATHDIEPTFVSTTRTLNLRASLPVRITSRSSQSVALTWRRERETLPSTELGAPSDAVGPTHPDVDLGGLELAWSLSTVKQYPYSISPVDGARLRLAIEKEDPFLGSDFALTKVTADGRAYFRLGDAPVLAVRGQGGFTLGEPRFRRTFAVGGFPESNLFDLQRTNLSVLRGYADDAFMGRSFLSANLEYRVPLHSLQRGYRTLPLFVRHLHGAFFLDAAHAWNGPFRLRDVKTGVGVAVGADTYIGHRLPVTAVVGVAHGLADRGDTRGYFRVGLAF